MTIYDEISHVVVYPSLLVTQECFPLSLTEVHANWTLTLTLTGVTEARPLAPPTTKSLLPEQSWQP